MPIKFEKICVVLVEPQGPMNIGSVCRSMMNFGFSGLRLVNPAADHLSDPARKMAVNATPLLEAARIFPTLPEALTDCQLIFGATRRLGKYRQDLLLPSSLADYIAEFQTGSAIALVFGREDDGLTTSELDLCHYFVTIPTSKALPSMNLAQAVTVCLYELAGKQPAAESRFMAPRVNATSEVVERMFQHMRQTLLDIGYLDRHNPDHILRTFRRIFGRSGLDEREARIIQGVLSKIDWVESERRKNKTHGGSGC